MRKSTILVFKFDGILVNTVEVFSRRVWQIISNLNLTDQATDDQKIDRLVVMNWEKGPKILARIICEKLDAKEIMPKFERELTNIEYRMAAEFRLNQERFMVIQKLANADFTIALYSNRSAENLQDLARIVELDLRRFDYILTKDLVPSLSGWLKDKKISSDLIYFGNTMSDTLLAPEDSVVILPEFNQDGLIEEDFLVNYLENNFLKTVAFNHA